MTIRSMLAPALGCAFLAGAAVAAFATKDRWQPVLFPGDAPTTPSHADGDHPPEGLPDRVKLSAEAQANLKLDVDTLETQAYWRTIQIPGMVVDQPGESDRIVTARLAGVVDDILARPGDTLRGGDPLFKLHLASEFVQGTQGELAKAARELKLAEAKRDRTAGFVKLGTTPESALAEDDANVKRYSGQVQAYRRQLQVFGLSPAQLDLAERGEPVTESILAAPGDRENVYEMQDLKVQLGESVIAGQPLGTLANHRRLFVEGHAFKSEAAALARILKDGTPVTAEFTDERPGEWPPQKPLTVRHLSNQVDPVSRTFAFYLELDNQPTNFQRGGRTHYLWRYRPGQRVRLKVPVEKLGDDVYVLPAGAIVRDGPEAFVFVQNGDLFVRKPVRVLFEDRKDVVIANDGSIGPATFVVKNQAAALNRAVKAASSGGHEGHHHDHDH